jgi:predicted phage terminase large subunit-like protein
MTAAAAAFPRKQTVRLHYAQQAFLHSKALFRSFCGGIGSGKSWAGSYDLIRRAKPGRLYLVVAPTYTLLADATFRSFLAVAEQLGVVEPDDVKKSAPPSIRLRTGAEVLFRSADQPDRLRGPNLSGVWLDEASLMDEDVFTVCIGRLREAGEQGWLSATFTPKGRQHWTYETFATGRPDTALFHARTADNPFLPSGFHATVRRQYTSVTAAQELEGEFIDSGGTMFRRDWFPIVDLVPQMVSLVRAWDLAATPKDETSARDPDYTVGVLMGRDASGNLYILDVRRMRGTPRQVEALVLQTAREDGRDVSIVMEQEPGSSGVAVIDHYLRLLQGFDFHGQRSTGNKADRAAPLAAQAEGGTVRLRRGPWNREFLDEVECFPFGRHDDQVDSASLCLAELAGQQQIDWKVHVLNFRPGPGLPPPRPTVAAFQLVRYHNSGQYQPRPQIRGETLYGPGFQTEAEALVFVVRLHECLGLPVPNIEVPALLSEHPDPTEARHEDQRRRGTINYEVQKFIEQRRLA